MKIKKVLVLILLAVSLVAFSVLSQISQVTDKISIEEKQRCTTNFYDEIQNIYGNCIHYYNYTSCLNSSGPNTACSLQQTQINFTCKTGQLIFTRNTTDCKPLNKFVVSINKGAVVEKKEIDFSAWGACINAIENGCLIVTCVSHEDGAFKGQFTNCKGGKSCQRFEICNNSIRVFYKNSRNEFVESDPTFYIDPLTMKEVGQ